MLAVQRAEEANAKKALELVSPALESKPSEENVRDHAEKDKRRAESKDGVESKDAKAQQDEKGSSEQRKEQDEKKTADTKTAAPDSKSSGEAQIQDKLLQEKLLKGEIKPERKLAGSGSGSDKKDGDKSQKERKDVVAASAGKEEKKEGKAGKPDKDSKDKDKYKDEKAAKEKDEKEQWFEEVLLLDQILQSIRQTGALPSLLRLSVHE